MAKFLLFLSIQLLLFLGTESFGGIDESYPYSEYYYGCISGRYFGDLGFVSDQHPVSECIDKCQESNSGFYFILYSNFVVHLFSIER